MTTRISNNGFIGVLDPVALDGIGWTATMKSEIDYSSIVVQSVHYTELTLTKDYNDVGGGSITLDLDDPVFSNLTRTTWYSNNIRDQEGLWQIYHDGVLRGEFLAEDVEEKIIEENNGQRTVTISGRGPGAVLDRAKVFPPDPNLVNFSFDRTFEGPAMHIFVILLYEAQARGTIPYVKLMFNSTNDSAGNVWTDHQKLTFSTGDSMLDILDQCCALVGRRWFMRPGFKLYVLPEEGNHREGKVVFTTYSEQKSAGRKTTRREIANIIGAQAGDKSMALATSGASVTRWGRREAWISAGNANDAGTAQIAANTTSGIQSNEVTQRTAVVPYDAPGRLVFQDYEVGDWVGLEVQDYPTDTSAYEPKHVAAISIKVDQDANVECELTMESKFEVRQKKLQRILDKLGGSTLAGGKSAPATPIKSSQVILTSKMSELSDVALSNPMPGQPLVWNGTKWSNSSTGSSFPLLEAMGIDIVSNTVSASSLAFALKGNLVRATVGGTLQEIIAYGNWVVGGSYKVGLYELTDPAGTPIVAVLGETNVSGPSGSGLRNMSATGLGWPMISGKLYLVGVTDLASDTAPLPMGTGSSLIPVPGMGVSVLRSFGTSATRAAAAGTALNVTKTSVGYCITTRVRPS